MNRGAILKWLNRKNRIGNFVVICGPPQIGKTHLLSHIIKKSLDDGFEIITTLWIPALGKSKDYHYITSITDLIQAYIDTKKPYNLAVDDAQAVFDATTRASTTKSKTIFDLYVHIAKLEGNLIFVAHDPNKIPTTLRTFGPLMVYLTEIGKFEVMGNRYQFPESPYKIFKAQFSGFDSQQFPIGTLFNKLSRIRGKTNEDTIKQNKKVMIKFLDEFKKNKTMYVSKRTQAEIMLKVLKDDLGKEVKLTGNYLAEKLDVDPGYISRIKKSVL